MVDSNSFVVVVNIWMFFIHNLDYLQCTGKPLACGYLNFGDGEVCILPVFVPLWECSLMISVQFSIWHSLLNKTLQSNTHTQAPVQQEVCCYLHFVDDEPNNIFHKEWWPLQRLESTPRVSCNVISSNKLRKKG